jgi:hypothetical protein
LLGHFAPTLHPQVAMPTPYSSASASSYPYMMGHGAGTDAGDMAVVSFSGHGEQASGQVDYVHTWWGGGLASHFNLSLTPPPITTHTLQHKARGLGVGGFGVAAYHHHHQQQQQQQQHQQFFSPSAKARPAPTSVGSECRCPSCFLGSLGSLLSIEQHKHATSRSPPPAPARRCGLAACSTMAAWRRAWASSCPRYVYTLHASI